MASGWGPDGAVQDQIDSTVDNAVQRARDALGGESERVCQECGEEIPQACATACLVRLKSRLPVAFITGAAVKISSYGIITGTSVSISLLSAVHQRQHHRIRKISVVYWFHPASGASYHDKCQKFGTTKLADIT